MYFLYFVIAASYWGKFKTVFQMIMVIVLMLNQYLCNPVLNVIGILLIVVATTLTVISLVDYIWKNKSVLKEQK